MANIELQGNCIAIEYDIIRDNIQMRYEFNRGMAKGEFVAMYFKDKPNQLFICCPKCGDCSFTSTHRITVDNGFYSADPSLVMNCCSWHGHLVKNVFKGN